MILKRLYDRHKYGKISGVYILRFTNGKIYIGSSKNIDRRITEHLENLVNRDKLPWYIAAAKENNIPTREELSHLSYKAKLKKINNMNIQIYYYPCNDYVNKENELLKAINDEDKKFCYNIVFPKT